MLVFTGQRKDTGTKSYTNFVLSGDIHEKTSKNKMPNRKMSKEEINERKTLKEKIR